jgi:hypothetical protein
MFSAESSSLSAHLQQAMRQQEQQQEELAAFLETAQDRRASFSSTTESTTNYGGGEVEILHMPKRASCPDALSILHNTHFPDRLAMSNPYLFASTSSPAMLTAAAAATLPPATPTELHTPLTPLTPYSPPTPLTINTTGRRRSGGTFPPSIGGSGGSSGGAAKANKRRHSIATTLTPQVAEEILSQTSMEVSRNITPNVVAKCRTHRPPFRGRRFSLKAVRQKAVVEVCGFAVDESGQYENEDEKRTVMNILERARRQVRKGLGF